MTIIVHTDQTVKQPVVWRCLNPHCFAKPADRFFEFERDQPVCPKCSADGYPIVQKRILIHFIVSDNTGPIEGEFGRFRFACDPPRELLATLSNGEACSGEVAACNCPGCLKAIGNAVAAHGARATEIKRRRKPKAKAGAK